MSEPILVTDSLTKRFGRRTAVDGLSFRVDRGDIFGFLGQNGAGKSTTIRMTLGLVRPTSGSIRMLGFEMNKNPRAALARTGAIVETPAFYERFSGKQNLCMFAAMTGRVSGRRIDEVLEIVGLLDRCKDPVSVYSHGMRQRLGIAQALVHVPEFVILDEPTDGLDPRGIREMRVLITRMRDEAGVTVLISSHLLHEIEQICDRVAIIDRGRLLYQGAVADLVSRHQTVKITLDRPEDACRLLASNNPSLTISRNGTNSLHLKMDREEIHRVNALLVANGFRVMELRPENETLEDIFLRLTSDKETITRAHSCEGD
jgi:ABC-2 type transport system ATP-binding protein